MAQFDIHRNTNQLTRHRTPYLLGASVASLLDGRQEIVAAIDLLVKGF
jgi:hypothetical protein